jgi:hypothetical protein
MALYIYDPHIFTMGENLLSFLFKKRAPRKHEYLVKLLQENNEVRIYTDFMASYLPLLRNNKNMPLMLVKLIAWIDLSVWCLNNKVGLSKVYTKIQDLDHQKDIIFGWGTVNSIFENDKRTAKASLHDFDGKKVIYINHYFVNTANIARNIQTLSNLVISAEAPLPQNSGFFREYFKKFDSFYVLPFACKKSFENKTPFVSRKNKALATGTYLEFEKNDPNHQPLMEYFNETTLHPMRKKIYLDLEKVKEQIDSIIAKFPYNDEKKNIHYNNQKGIAAYITKIFAKEQKKYLQLDVAQQYNQYTMIVAPEENAGLPSINFIEAMRCGCALIAIDDLMYSSIGLKAHEDYIVYDGSLQDLIRVIKLWQSKVDKLEVIARKGQDFAERYFMEDRVSDLFFNDLVSKFQQTGSLSSSFVIDSVYDLAAPTQQEILLNENS